MTCDDVAVSQDCYVIWGHAAKYYWDRSIVMSGKTAGDAGSCAVRSVSAANPSGLIGDLPASLRAESRFRGRGRRTCGGAYKESAHALVKRHLAVREGSDQVVMKMDRARTTITNIVRVGVGAKGPGGVRSEEMGVRTTFDDNQIMNLSGYALSGEINVVEDDLKKIGRRNGDVPSNLSSDEWEALERLEKNDQIIVKQSDKGGHRRMILRERFRDRGYPDEVLDLAFRNAMGKDRRSLLQTKSKPEVEDIPRIIGTYDNQVNRVFSILNKHWGILQMDETLFGRVPLTYTRFSLTPQTDGDSSQVEMKLADEEECGDQPMGDHLVSHQSGKNGCKSLCFKILVVVLLFLIGFLIGYLTYRGRACPRQSSNGGSEECLMANGVTEDEEPEPAMPPVMYWSSVRAMFVKKIDATSFVTQISRMASDSRDAGGDNEDNLAKMVHDNFNSARLDKVWDDEHYITLQDFNRNNKVTLLNGDSAEWMRTPTSYVAYSYAASVTGNLVYGNQGTEKDLKDLSGKTDLKGKVILMRSALIPFSEKARNAERVGAAGVLIYPEPMDMRFPDGKYSDDIEAPFGHAHFGTGDPFTPGFPSFNHTQFPPSISSGLPQIPVQTLSSNDGRVLYDKLQSAGCVGSGLSGCTLKVLLQVNNTMAEKKIYNVFGVIKGLEPDRYVVVGAQRDSVGMGMCKAAVGTSLLMELARMLSEMVKEGYKPRRSIVFASWSAGDYGAVGATEWLEGYLTTLHLKATSYISLDAIIQGSESLQVSTSPLLYNMIVKILKEIPDPVSNGQMSPKFSYGFPMDDSAYPFLTYSGIPAASFRFQKEDRRYAYLGTDDDTFEHFDKLNMNLDVKWMNSALGDFNRAVAALKKDFLDSDLENNPFLRSLNDRIMKVEHSMLFPYVSPKESPFRHILYGYGNHTFDAMKKHLDLLKEDKSKFNEDVFKNQLALLTWTVQSAANALEGEIWEIDNEF
ncbi:unnamed protein product [Ranitomeya imitator]|uniref:Transferrin receptor protein 1 n=1 Tax=Ranitomeya imitator TaxID=111125 RepID=A0ABN9L6A6_9NEOB|nr:unnamed protein product [Ranitomeya imitator]